MNSSMLAGERRWASSRRGGMTVLGKVAVPKPLNLPSQRLENHGLDPNVEIVPKGTLSWGSRPSSSGSNPWVSSSLSPNTEGGNVSPSHLSGRPSSGGSGTRPSTAGSERTHEHVANSWGSNSRPSSASGNFSSNQASSTSLRPRSAENRPNSSQLSRFADPVSKSSAAWGTSGTAERLGVKSSKDDGFSLNTGDFPTLGTEKDNSMKNTELEDHGRPSSASGIISHGKEDTRSQADVKHGTVNTWRADDPQGADNDYHPSMEKWHADNPQYFNSYTVPQHFDTWRGPPMNGPANVWYGGGPRGPPYGAPVRPGGFPLEPFPYYRPQIAPPPLAGSQPVPPQGPRGHHPRNGDLYRPQLPDSYARPGMPPFRPGYYPAPSGPPGPMAFESFYGPPMGYERDIPYMGMAAGPPVYNGSYPGPAPDLGNSHGRNVRGHHGGKTSPEQVESEDNTHGTKRVTLKTSNQCDQMEEGETQEHNVQQFDISYPEKNRLPIISSRKSEWGAEEDTDEAMYDKRKAPSEMQPRNIEHRVHSADGVRVKSFERMSNAKAVHDNWSNAPKSGPSFPPEMSRVHLGSERESSVPSGTRNPTLMQKIDGLNAKIRVSDGWNDLPSAYNREEERNRSHVSDMKVNYNTGKVSNTAGPLERTPASRDFVSIPHEVSVPVTDKPTQPMIASRRHHHGGQQGRVDYRGKVKFNNGQDADGWQKKSLTAEASSTITASHNESLHSSQAHGPDNVDASESSVTSNPVGKVEGDSVETHDSIDIQAQRAKLRESVKQRTLQLQKEEEERTREQRAKALAKLEELNRRTLAGEAVSDMADKGEVINAIQGERHESRTVDEPVMADHSNANQAGESFEIPKNIPLESNISTLPEHEDAHDNSVKKPAPQYNNSKHKRTSYKQKQSNPLQKSFTEKPVSNVADEPQKDHILGEAKLSESTVPNTSDTVVEPPAPQRRKNNRSGKNKQHKLDETPLPPPVESTDVNPGKDSIENVVAKNTLSDWDSAFSVEPDKSMPAQEVLSSSPNEESHSMVSNQWKPHPSRRLPRNQQVNNKVHGGDNTAVWAPVRTQNRAKGPVEAGPNPVQESTNSTNGNNNNMGQSSLKGKRAEMERYVPKPVAKELAQQVNVPNSSSSVTSSRSNDWSIGEVNEGDIFHNKHRKDQGAWKQRGPPTDSSHVKGAHSTSEPTKEIQLSKEIIGQSVKSEIDSLNTGDGYNLPNNNMNKAKYPLVKDQGVTGRGKRNGPKGPAASTGNNNNNPDHENTFSGEVDMNQMDRTKENRASSHWQPKPSSNTANNQQHGNRTGSLTTETKSIPKKEHPQHRVVEGGNFTPQPGQSVNVKSNVAQESTAGHRQEFEKRAKGRPYSPNQEPVAPGELPHAATEDVRFERNAPFGSRRNSRQNNRSGRGHEPRGEWVPGHDNRPHNNAPPFVDNRQRQNLHYEYQPVGPFKGNMPERVEEPADGTDGMDKRHGERGHGQPRRGGNFSRRQSGPSSHVGSSGWE